MQRRLIWVTLFSVAIVVTALYHTRKVHATPIHDHHRGCSVASLKGTYAFRNNLVVLDGGKRFFLLSVAPETITTEEGKRLEVED